MEAAQAVERFVKDSDGFLAEIGRRIVGQKAIIDGLLTCCWPAATCCSRASRAGQDALVRTLADALDLSFSRIQFTPGPDARRHHRHQHPRRDAPRAGAASSSSRGPSSRTWCWPTRSTAPPPRPSPRCWRRCRSTGHRRPHHPRPAPALLRAGHPEPDRDRGHLPAARGPARSLPVQAAGGCRPTGTSCTPSWTAPPARTRRSCGR